MIRLLDMFCGAGGSSRGALMAGATPVAAIDMWDLAAKTYKLNFPDAHVYRAKTKSISPKRIIDEAGPIDLILASPECTNHSVAKGSAPRCEESKASAFEVIRFAKAIKPRWIVIENVIQMQSWHRYAEFVEQLSLLRYNVKPFVVDSQDFGTPQARRRLIVVCDRESDPCITIPMRIKKKVVSDILSIGEQKESPWSFTPLRCEGRAEATLERAQRAIKAVGRNKPFILVYYGSDGSGGFQRIDRPLRTVTTLDRFALVQPTPRGHEMRMLQPTELAAAMGFPKSHKWPIATRRERIKLIGNAVCPPVMKGVLTGLIPYRACA